MSVNSELVGLLSPSEQRDFVRHLSRRNKRNDTRNVDLFRALTKGKEEAIRKEIGSNAYNVLNKRLSDRLLDYMAVSILESEATQKIAVLKQLLVARKLISHGKFKLAFRLLDKAEKEALRIQDFSLLNDIYHTLIEYSYHALAPDQELVFRNYALYKEELLNQERLNMAYAVIRKAFHTSRDFDLDSLLQESFERFSVSNDQIHNFQTLYQLTQIADIAGAHRRDYHSIDLFFIDRLKELKGGELDNERYLIYHIDILHLIANIYFRKKDFKKSLDFLADMHEQMVRYDLRYYQQREMGYCSLLALNLNFLGRHEAAASVLDEFLEDNSKAPAKWLLNPQLIRVMIHFQQGELEEAYKLLSKFQRADSWYERSVGLEWNLQKKYIEILLHIELGNIDYVDACISSFTRKYGKHFKSASDTNVLPFLKLVKQYYQNAQVIETEKFKNKVESSIAWKPVEEEDIFLMCFYAWLKSKMESRDIYEVTLELVTGA